MYFTSYSCIILRAPNAIGRQWCAYQRAVTPSVCCLVMGWHGAVIDGESISEESCEPSWGDHIAGERCIYIYSTVGASSTPIHPPLKIIAIT